MLLTTNFTVRVVFQKRKNCFKISSLAISGRRNFAIITDRQKFITKLTLYGMFSFHFTVRINSKSCPGLYVTHEKDTYPNFRQRPMSDITYHNQ